MCPAVAVPDDWRVATSSEVKVQECFHASAVCETQSVQHGAVEAQSSACLYTLS